MISSNLTQEIAVLHADLCSALAEPTRLVILYALDEKPCNVSELAQKLDTPQPTISRHLKILRESGLVKANRQGAMVQYELSDRRVIEALDLLRAVLRDRIEHRASLIDELKTS